MRPKRKTPISICMLASTSSGGLTGFMSPSPVVVSNITQKYTPAIHCLAGVLLEMSSSLPASTSDMIVSSIHSVVVISMMQWHGQQHHAQAHTPLSTALRVRSSPLPASIGAGEVLQSCLRSGCNPTLDMKGRKKGQACDPPAVSVA